MASSEEYLPSKNQVAGHRFEEGRVGSLVDGKGLFYKPLQGGERGHREVAFYQKFWSDESVPANIKRFFPKFFGLKELDAAGPVGKLEHAALEDLTHAYKHPSIVDVKMGQHTWYPGCGAEYEEKCRAKDATTPSGVLGFRVSGMQVYDPKTGETWRAEREWGKSLDGVSTAGGLKRFIAPGEDEQSRREGAARIRELLSYLKELQQWFETQGTYHFYSASLLVMYDSSSTSETASGKTGQKLEVRMIDFAHVTEGKGEPDTNFLFGLRKLIEVFTQLLAEVEST